MKKKEEEKDIKHMEDVKRDIEKMKMKKKAEGESDKDIEDWAKNVEGLIKRDLEYVKISKEERRKREIGTKIKMIEDESKNIKEEKNVNIYELNRALKNHAKSFKVEVVSDISPFKQAVMTRSSIESKINKELVNMKGFKVLETLHICL